MPGWFNNLLQVIPLLHTKLYDTGRIIIARSDLALAENLIELFNDLQQVGQLRRINPDRLFLVLYPACRLTCRVTPGAEGDMLLPADCNGGQFWKRESE